MKKLLFVISLNIFLAFGQDTDLEKDLILENVLESVVDNDSDMKSKSGCPECLNESDTELDVGCVDEECDQNAECIENKCKCKRGYDGDGKQCFLIEACSHKYCKKNGVCVYNNGYKCKCGLECANGGVCRVSKFKYHCVCPKNATGVTCERVWERKEKRSPSYYEY